MSTRKKTRAFLGYAFAVAALATIGTASAMVWAIRIGGYALAAVALVEAFEEEQSGG